MSFSDFDRHMMTIALSMARRGLGTTAPNPSVGAVLADERTGEVIARGVTQPGGRPHAEPEALRRAGDAARGATLYVTLEPCAHHGKTPPCADAIVAAGVARVVVGAEDPDPRTRGRGLARLRAAGIRVEAGLMADEARWVTRGHALCVTDGRPFVTVKMALDATGEVPRGGGGRALMVTGAEARAQGHRLRAESDAILIGAATARDDDPELTCRLPGLSGRSPVRVVVSRALDVLPGLKLFQTAREVPVWIFVGDNADPERVRTLEALGARVLRVPRTLNPSPRGGGEPAENGLSIRDVLAQLGSEGVTRVLVEGGPSMWRAFAAAARVDEAVVFQAEAARGRDTDAVALAARYCPGVDLAPAAQRRVGADLMTVLRPRLGAGAASGQA